MSDMNKVDEKANEKKKVIVDILRPPSSIKKYLIQEKTYIHTFSFIPDSSKL